jgi:hypothetical protein
LNSTLTRLAILPGSLGPVISSESCFNLTKSQKQDF